MTHTLLTAARTGNVEALITDLDERASFRFDDTPDPIAVAALGVAVAHGQREVVAALLAREGASPDTPSPIPADEYSIPDIEEELTIAPLFIAASGGDPALSAFIENPLGFDPGSMVRHGDEVVSFVEIAETLLGHGATVDPARDGTGLTPLMVATAFGQRELIEILVHHGADPGARDVWGRTAERYAIFATLARVIEVCRGLPMVGSAYVAQIHDPVGLRYTTPLVGLELDGALPADAFGGWPTDDPIVVFVLGDDAVSQLVRLTGPVYVR